MDDATRLAAVEDVPEGGSKLFTVREADGSEEEVVLVRPPGDAAGDCVGGSVAAWRNFCQHETDQRLDRGFGVAMRGGEVVCPKHGSMFDACSGYCDNGKAAGSTLVAVEVALEDGDVYLTDQSVEFLHDGGIEADDDDDDVPGSTSHLSF